MSIGLGLSIASTVGGALMAGRQADKNKKLVEEAKAAAEGVYKDKLRDLSQKQKLQEEASELQYTAGMEELGVGAQAESIGVADFTTGVEQKSNLVTSAIQHKVDEQTKDLWSKYKTGTQMQMDQKALADAQAAFDYRTGSKSAEEAYETEIASYDDIPTTYLEGVGQSLFG